MILAAAAAIDRQLAPADTGELFGALTTFSGLIGQNWTMAGRTEWIDLAVQELDREPGELVLDSLRRARRKVTDGRLLVAWVCEDIGADAAALRAELAMIDRVGKLI